MLKGGRAKKKVVRFRELIKIILKILVNNYYET